ncbi:MAG: IS66 family transposase [Thermodesulfobacteriota bacterium]
MTREEAAAILKLPWEDAIQTIQELGLKAEKYDQLVRADVATPSGQRPTYKKQNRPKHKNKKPGRKKGHPGCRREVPAHIDHYEDHKLETCPHCQVQVEPGIKAYTRYTEDIPPIRPKVTEHTIYKHWCPGCRDYVTAPVTDAMENANLSLRLVVVAAWLHYSIGISVRNVVRIFNVVCSFPVSPGGLTQAWIRLAELLRPEYDNIKELIRHSAALHADETGWRLSGMTYWLWAFCTKEYCYYTITKCRGSPVVEQVLGTLFNGVLICDFYGAYNLIQTLAKQRCYFHLFTDLVKVDKTNTSKEWKAFRKKLKRLLRDALRLRDQKQNLKPGSYESRKKRLHQRLEMLIEVGGKDKDVKRLVKRLKRHEDEMLTFLDYDDVSPYNNHGEQQIRPAVNCRKVSFRNRSEAGAEAQAILMSLFRTALLQKLNPIEYVKELAVKAIENRHIQKMNRVDLAMAA